MAEGSGIRDAGLPESTLARPVNRWVYGDEDVATLAAACAYGVARNHPFVDGNNRTVWVLARLFRAVNGAALHFDQDDAIRTVLALAAGDRPEDELADCFGTRIAERRSARGSPLSCSPAAMPWAD